MASSHSNKEWLRKNIKKGNIRLYSFKDFIDPVYIGVGGYGTVFKAKVKTLGRIVAYKFLHSQNEDEMFENFVKEVCVYNGAFLHLDIIVHLNYPLYSSLKFIVRSMTTLT